MKEKINKPRSLEALINSGQLWSRESGNLNKASSQGPSSSLLAKFGIPALDTVLPSLGLPFGHIHEFAFEYSQRNERKLETPFWILSWLLANSQRQESIATFSATTNRHLIIWIDSQCWPTPHTLESVYRNTHWRKHNLFLNPKDKQSRLWSITETLRQKCVFAVIANASDFSPQAYRKLQLAIQHGGGIALLIRKPKEFSNASPAYSRWKVSPFAHSSQLMAWELELKKIKGTLRTGSELPRKWQIYWNKEHGNGQGSLDIFSETTSKISTEKRTNSAA